MPGFVTFLSKLGKYLAEGIAVFAGIEPLVAPLFGSNTKVTGTLSTVVNDLNQIGQVVVQAEALIQTPGSGAQKLAAAAPLVANIIKTSELVGNHKIKNETLFIQGCTDMTNAVAEILNALDSGGVNSSGNPTPPIPTPTVVPPSPAIPPTVPVP
jgi:hypothetical protein